MKAHPIRLQNSGQFGNCPGIVLHVFEYLVAEYQIKRVVFKGQRVMFFVNQADYPFSLHRTGIYFLVILEFEVAAKRLIPKLTELMHSTAATTAEIHNDGCWTKIEPQLFRYSHLQK